MQEQNLYRWGRRGGRSGRGFSPRGYNRGFFRGYQTSDTRDNHNVPDSNYNRYNLNSN